MLAKAGKGSLARDCPPSIPETEMTEYHYGLILEEIKKRKFITNYLLESRTKTQEDIKEAERIFGGLKKLPMAPAEREKIRAVASSASGLPQVYIGQVVQKFANYCFVKLNDPRIDVFIHESKVGTGDWEAIIPYSQVKFNLGFSFKGPVGFDVCPYEADKLGIPKEISQYNFVKN